MEYRFWNIDAFKPYPMLHHAVGILESQGLPIPPEIVGKWAPKFPEMEAAIVAAGLDEDQFVAWVSEEPINQPIGLELVEQFFNELGGW